MSYTMEPPYLGNQYALNDKSTTFFIFTSFVRPKRCRRHIPSHPINLVPFTASFSTHTILIQDHLLGTYNFSIFPTNISLVNYACGL